MRPLLLPLTIFTALELTLRGASGPVHLGPLQVQTNREALLSVVAPTGQWLRLEASTDLLTWTGLSTWRVTATNTFTDSTAPFMQQRFYRAAEAPTNSITGDHIVTEDGEVTVHPVEHASFLMTWKDKTLYCDPVGGAAPYQGLPRGDLILVTHGHGDHFNANTINAIRSTNAFIVAPNVVYQGLSTTLKAQTIVLTNGATTNLHGIDIEAVPAYNLTAAYHPKGVGNGYVLTIGDRRFYVSGDTEDVPELRQLKDIDVAFVCMNLPFTMSVEQAADAVREFKPGILYLYHFRGFTAADVNRFKETVGTDTGTEVRLRKWY